MAERNKIIGNYVYVPSWQRTNCGWIHKIDEYKDGHIYSYALGFVKKEKGCYAVYVIGKYKLRSEVHYGEYVTTKRSILEAAMFLHAYSRFD